MVNSSKHINSTVPATCLRNELIGNPVIIPPARDVKTAQKLPKQYECYDWWFCHRELESIILNSCKRPSGETY